MRPTPPVRATQIAQLFKAEAVNIAVSASKDGKLRVVYAGWGGPPRWRCPLGEGPVADNGIDAQWQGDLSAEALTAGPFLSAGANVFQYKKREVTDQTRSRLVADMCADLRGAVVEVERRSGPRPAAYVLLYQYRSARWSAIYAGD